MMSNEEAILLDHIRKRDALLHALEAITVAEAKGLEYRVMLQQSGTDLTIQRAVTALNEHLPLFISAAVDVVKGRYEEDIRCEEHNIRLAARELGQSAPSLPSVLTRREG